MKILGITAEYNPFHNGHLYLLNRAREMTGAGHTVVAMSGDFTQRGEPAMMNKWARSRAAVLCGADLVAELPFIYACSRGDSYARGAVRLLASMGATHIAFGCEAEDPGKLRELAEVMFRESDEIDSRSAELMKEGISRAKAVEVTVERLMGPESAELLKGPNNILGLEYLKCIRQLKAEGSDIEAVIIERKGSGYFSANEGEGYAGASWIRGSIKDDSRYGDIENFMPEAAAAVMKEECSSKPVGLAQAMRNAEENFFRLARFELVRSGGEQLSGIYSIGEGIENRLKKAAVRTADLRGLIDFTVSRRYSAATVRRMLTYIIMGLAKSDGADPPGITRSPEYIRLLAAGQGGRELIKMNKSEDIFSLPVITNVNKCEAFHDLLWDIKAADMYNIITGGDIYSSSDRVLMPYMDR